MRPAAPGGAFDFHVKTSVSGRKRKDFAILWFSTWAAFTGSCRFHVGFSVVVIFLVISVIVEYAFVYSVEWRQAEQEIRSGWNFCLYKRVSFFPDVLKCLRYQEIREMINRRIFKYIEFILLSFVGAFESLSKSPLNVGFLKRTFLSKFRTSVR